MRNLTTPTLSFTDANGRTFAINDFQPYPKYSTWFQYPVQTGDDLDEIASKSNVYGSGSEANYYQIVEHNIALLFDVKFDLNKIETLNIPLP